MSESAKLNTVATIACGTFFVIDGLSGIIAITVGAVLGIVSVGVEL